MLNNDNLKIFFLFPQKLIFEDIAEVLIAEQNEAFVLNNHIEFKDALKLFNKKSLAFINIDSVLSESEWIEYVRELQEDPQFSNVKVGILSFNPDKKLIDLYKNELKIECGYHILSSRNHKYKEDIKKVVSLIESENTKKILKLDFTGVNPVSFSIKEKSQFITGSIDALSTAAMSITLEHDKVLKKGMELKHIVISYSDKDCKIMGTVIGNSQFNKNQFVIKFNTLFEDFHKGPLFSIIHEVLDSQMKQLVK